MAQLKSRTALRVISSIEGVDHGWKPCPAGRPPSSVARLSWPWCSSKVQQPYGTQLAAAGRDDPVDLRQCPSMTLLRLDGMQEVWVRIPIAPPQVERINSNTKPVKLSASEGRIEGQPWPAIWRPSLPLYPCREPRLSDDCFAGGQEVKGVQARGRPRFGCPEGQGRGT